MFVVPRADFTLFTFDFFTLSVSSKAPLNSHYVRITNPAAKIQHPWPVLRCSRVSYSLYKQQLTQVCVICHYWAVWSYFTHQRWIYIPSTVLRASGYLPIDHIWDAHCVWRGHSWTSDWTAAIERQARTEASQFNDESDQDSNMAEREALEREIEKLQSKTLIYFVIGVLQVCLFYRTERCYVKQASFHCGMFGRCYLVLG